MLDDEIIDLDQLVSVEGGCNSSRRAFCLGAGAGLLVIAAGCGVEDPRVETGGIDNQPGPLPATPDMAQKTSTTNGGTTGSTNGGTNGGTTTGTTGGTTSGTGGTNGGTTGSTTGGTASCASNFIAAGAASAVAVGKAKRIRSGNLDAWLCHDSSGYYALDNYCPHRGCTVSFLSSGSFSCPCHGWTFNFGGSGSRGSMDHLSMCIDNSGNAFIDPSQTVSAATRV